MSHNENCACEKCIPDPLTALVSNLEKKITFVYKNYRGEIGVRTVIPQKIWFGSTEYHDVSQWLLTAFDVEKNADRDFALTDIIDFKK
jgi:predicted DNA-binding transcriptional regulator YafY